ncbi:MAG: MBL fold metallo-hydrolase, partial [Solobacterium sp.]|nr:MBL fold metallo-hydrolase [Solobacterium sp.]
MRIEQRVIGPCITNVYLLISEKNNAVLIDPADDADQIIQWIKDSGVTLKYIFITHGHADHVLALKEVRD